jgi:RNA polymerase sigma factor (sigma-70 family)
VIPFTARSVGRQGPGARDWLIGMYSSETLTGRRLPSFRLPARLIGEDRLARMAARGEGWAFEALFARYHRELYAYCRAILEEPEEAQDAVQNTMTAALRHLPNLERRKSLRGWLYRVAHNEAISLLRRRGTVPVDPDRVPEGTVPGADVTVQERERLRQLVADLRELPGRQRSALVMRELSDLDYSQIAAALETSQPAARQLVYEARASLRTVELGRAGIETRRSDLSALFPPLGPGAASGLLASLVSGGGGTAVGGIGVKAVSIASAVALGAGAVGISGGIKSPFGAGDEQRATTVATSRTPLVHPPSQTPRASRADGSERAAIAPARLRSEAAHSIPRRGQGARGNSASEAARAKDPGGGPPSPRAADPPATAQPPAHAATPGAQASGSPTTPPGASGANPSVPAGSRDSTESPSPPSNPDVVLGGPEVVPDKPSPNPSSQLTSANTKP